MNYITIAKEVFEVESTSIRALSNRIDLNFDNVIKSILNSNGRTIVCGMGKSGIIGKKISATFASTGTPSFFMHPAEAFHGDLGMVQREDNFIAISYSGETEEVIKLLPYLKKNGNNLISLTGEPNSTLARSANFNLDISVDKEACPLQLAPTASTTATLAMGDALAIALMKARNFKPENFAQFHPGGSLGRRLLNTVADEMIQSKFPIVTNDAKFLEVVHSITRGGLGVCLVQDEDEFGLITDGDLRRAIDSFSDSVFSKDAASLMTKSPITINPAASVDDAFVCLEKNKITSLLVKDKNKIIGIFKK
jgi:arabinose-5-phosphate isomerase